MKNVMFVLPRMNGGGAERVVSIVANHLARKTEYKINIVVLVSNDSFYPLDANIDFQSANYLVNRKNKITRLYSLGRNFFNSIGYVKNQIRNQKPDIVCSVLPEADLVTYFAMRGMKNIKRVCSERNDPTQRGGGIAWLLSRVYDKTDAFICQTKTVAQYYEGLVCKKYVIPNPIDASRYPSKEKEGEVKRIVAVGRLVKQKNIPLLIHSFVRIANEFPNVQLDIYGEGPERIHLEMEISTLHMEKRIHLRGSQGNVLSLITDATMFVMSSDYEGFPNALVEAIAIGLPVISTDFATGVAREIITDHVGIVVPCGNEEKMADAMRTLLRDSARRNRIRDDCSRAIEPYLVQHVMQMWEELFVDLGEWACHSRLKNI